MRRVLVYCGSSPGCDPAFLRAAAAFGGGLARRRLGLVFGGGGAGLMGAVADAALAGGAEVIGIIPRGLAEREAAHRGLSDLRVVETMHQRKALMESLCDAIVALPGGIGTLDELCEALTWAQLGLHSKPLGLLNVGGYYDRFLDFLDHASLQGFLPPSSARRLMVAAEAEALLEGLAARAA